MKLNELFDLLHTFEISISYRADKKGREVAFQSINDEESSKKDKSSHESLTYSMAMLRKQFSKVVKKFNKWPNNYGNNSKDQNNLF